MAIAFEWAATAMTISAEMVVPGLMGYWLDQRLGTRVLFLFVGFALGGVLATLSLMRIARGGGKSPKGAGSPGQLGAGQSGIKNSGTAKARPSGTARHDKPSRPDAEG